MHLIRAIIAFGICAGLTSLALAQDTQSPQALCDAADPADLTTMQFAAAEDALEADIDYRAILCTAAGAIYVDLYEQLTPITVNNFVFLAQQGYYDNTTFHRVIPNFMAQAGDPTATGRGGPGYQFGDEPVSFLTFDRPGLLAMANAGPGTNGSQFFITTAPTPHLNYKHTIFGDVLLGEANVTAIQERDPAAATAPGETLQSVLIITDHSQVDNGDIIALTPATQAQVSAAFAAFSGSMPPTLPANADNSGLFTVADLTESVPANLQDAFADFADQYGFQYRARVEIENADCDSAIYFSSLGYQVDVFENASAAANALTDDLTRLVLESQGYQHDPVSATTYSKETPTCADKDGVQTRSLYTYSRYLVAIDVLVAKQILEQAGVTGQVVLADLSQQIEPAFAELFRPEIRS